MAGTQAAYADAGSLDLLSRTTIARAVAGGGEAAVGVSGVTLGGVALPAEGVGAVAAGTGIAAFYGTTQALHWADSNGWLPDWLSQRAPAPNLGTMSCVGELCALVTAASYPYGTWSAGTGHYQNEASLEGACGGVCFSFFNAGSADVATGLVWECTNLTTHAVTTTVGHVRAWGAGSGGYRAGWETPGCGTNQNITKVSGYSLGPGLTSGSAFTPTGTPPWVWNNPLAFTISATTRYYCRDSTGAVASGTVSSSYASGSSPPNVNVPACSTILPDSHLDRLTVTGTPGAGEDPVVLYDWKPFADAYNNSLSPDAGCTFYAGSTPCTLVLYRNGVSCNEQGTACTGWWEAVQAGSMQYSCKYGTVVHAISDCLAFRTSFDTETSTSPAPQPSTGTGLPETGTNPDSDPEGSPTATPGSGASCIGAAWGWNPVNWVYVPIKCALIWAFVPDSDALTERATSLQDAWTGSPPGVVVGAFTGVLGGLVGVFTISSAGCNGPGLGPIPQLAMTEVGYPLATCTGPMHYVVGIVRPLMTGLLYFTALKVALQVLASSIGFELPWRKPESVA
jgi:hypothetical protein